MPGRRQNSRHTWPLCTSLGTARRSPASLEGQQAQESPHNWPFFSLGLKVVVGRQVSVLLSAVNPCSLEYRGETRSLIPSLPNQEGLA